MLLFMMNTELVAQVFPQITPQTNMTSELVYDEGGEFNFVRVQFDTYYGQGFGCGTWSIDFPDADMNFLRGVSIIFFIFMPASNINAFLFGASFGFLWLSTVPATSGIVAHLFGTKYLGLLYGIVFLSHQVGSFFGAYLGGLFYDLYGSYDYAWYLAIALSVFAAIIHLPIREEPVLRLKTE